MQMLSSASYSDTKPHYALLDGLRGVAALLVVCYHVFEGYAFVGGGLIETINHGYLAVDFFFMLSGFVIAYAYDDRWDKTLSLQGFARRRLIRLHPMVVMGTVLGTLTFMLQGSVQWDGTSVAFSAVLWALLMGIFLIPAVPGGSYEVRGNGEMFPLNGPSWSLFFEYIGNLLYALVLRRLATRWLALLCAILAAALAWFTLTNVSGYGSLGVGWTLDRVNFLGGSLRMLFPFTLGMLLSRVFRPVKVRGAFWFGTLLLVLLFTIPYIAGNNTLCLNGLFEMGCLVLAFPLILWLGASGNTTDALSTRICKFLGDISFPLYIIHYPFMYLFYAWLKANNLVTLADTWQVALGVCLWNVLLAWLLLKLYDEPVRKWLAARKG